MHRLAGQQKKKKKNSNKTVNSTEGSWEKCVTVLSGEAQTSVTTALIQG